MEIVVFWLLFSIVVGVIASARGRSGFGWFLLAVLISPLLALLIVVLTPSRKAAPGAPTPETHVKCPDCAELVLREAKVCKHCGCHLVPQPSTTEIACQHCGGLVPRKALVCRHCNANLDPKSPLEPLSRTPIR